MMHTFYAVFDTNVLVSALMSRRADSPTVLLLDYVLDGRIVLLYNEDIIHEYEEVLHRGKFDFDEDSIQNLMELVKTGLHLDPTESDEIFAVMKFNKMCFLYIFRYFIVLSFAFSHKEILK